MNSTKPHTRSNLNMGPIAVVFMLLEASASTQIHLWKLDYFSVHTMYTANLIKVTLPKA